MSFASEKAKVIFSRDNLELGGVVLQGIGSFLSGFGAEAGAETALAVGKAQEARAGLQNSQRKLELARSRIEFALNERESLTRANQLHARAQVVRIEAVQATAANLAQASASGLRTGGSVRTLNAAIAFRASIVGSGLGLRGADERARAGSSREARKTIKQYANLSDLEEQSTIEVAKANAFANAASSYSRAGQHFASGAASFLEAYILRQEQQKRKEEGAEQDSIDAEAETTTTIDPLRRR